MNFIKRLFIWWGSQTLGTQLYTWRKGQLVGEDMAGNSYYQTKDGKRRWVIFSGEAEASKVTADWHGWLHFTFDELPSKTPLAHKVWEKPHVENLTSTVMAYAPAGSMRAEKPISRQDYEAWQPE